MRLTMREALLTFRRAPLLSVGLFGLVAVNLHRALREVAERVEIVAYLLPGTPVETVTLGVQDIAAFPEVQSVSYVTETEALARARYRPATWRGPSVSF